MPQTQFPPGFTPDVQFPPGFTPDPVSSKKTTPEKTATTDDTIEVLYKGPGPNSGKYGRIPKKKFDPNVMYMPPELGQPDTSIPQPAGETPDASAFTAYDAQPLTGPNKPLTMAALSGIPYTRQDLIKVYRTNIPGTEGLSDNQIFAQIAVKYPKLAIGIQELNKHQPAYHPPGRTAGSVAVDQAIQAAMGIPQAVTQIPAAITQTGDLIEQLQRGQYRQALETARPIYHGVVDPFVNTAWQGAELAAPYLGFQQRNLFGGAPGPDDPRTAAAARAGGTMLGGALLGEAIEAAPKAIPKIAAFIRRPGLTAAEVNSWMDVPASAVKRGANPGAQLLEDNLLGATKEITKANVDSALASTGQQLEQVLGQSTDVINGETAVTDAIDAAKKRIGRPRDTTFQNNLEGVQEDIRTNYPNLDHLSPLEAHKLKVDLGKSIRWKGTAFDDPINQAMLQIYNDLNGALKNVSGVAPLQARWGNLFVASENIADELAADVVGKGTGPGPPVAPSSPLVQLLRKRVGPWAVKGVVGGGIGYEILKYLAGDQKKK